MNHFYFDNCRNLDFTHVCNYVTTFSESEKWEASFPAVYRKTNDEQLTNVCNLFAGIVDSGKEYTFSIAGQEIKKSGREILLSIEKEYSDGKKSKYLPVVGNHRVAACIVLEAVFGIVVTPVFTEDKSTEDLRIVQARLNTQAENLLPMDWWQKCAIWIPACKADITNPTKLANGGDLGAPKGRGNRRSFLTAIVKICGEAGVTLDMVERIHKIRPLTAKTLGELCKAVTPLDALKNWPDAPKEESKTPKMVASKIVGEEIARAEVFITANPDVQNSYLDGYLQGLNDCRADVDTLKAGLQYAIQNAIKSQQ